MLPRHSQPCLWIVSGALEAWGATHEVVPQVFEEKLDRHLEEMAEEEGVAEIRELATLLPATELRGALVPEEGGQLLARDTPFRAGDPEKIVHGGGMHAHSEQR